jgi:hypothetical protein
MDVEITLASAHQRASVEWFVLKERTRYESRPCPIQIRRQNLLFV